MKKRLGLTLLAAILCMVTGPAGIQAAENREDGFVSDYEEPSAVTDTQSNATDTFQDGTDETEDQNAFEGDLTENGSVQETTEAFSDGSQSEAEEKEQDGLDDAERGLAGFGEVTKEENPWWTEDYLSWEFYNDGTLKIEGWGRIGGVFHMVAEKWRCPWKECINQVTKIVISGNITDIGNGAFSGYPNLTSVELPDSVKHIFHDAFAVDYKLKTINFPDRLVAIDNNAFGSCLSLEEVTIPANCETLQEYCFSNSGLKKVTFKPGSKLTVIPEHAFSYCRSLEEITIPSNVRSCYEVAFCECTSLKKVNIEGSDDREPLELWNGCFADCTSLEEINGKVCIYNDFDSAFYNCESLKTITLYPDSSRNKIIPKETFYGCTSLESVHWTFTPNIIGENAFYGCKNLQAIELTSDEEKEVTIEKSAFSGCRGLNSVTISDTLAVKIEENAFYCTVALTGINGSENIVDMESRAFCASGIKSFSFGNKITEIKPYVFDGAELEDIKLSGTIKVIGEHAFAGVETQEKSISLQIPSGVVSIGRDAFYGWRVSEVEIPASVQEIGEGAFSFYSTTSFDARTIVIEKGASGISDSAFGSAAEQTVLCYTGSEEEWNQIGFHGQVKNVYYNYDRNHEHVYEDEITREAGCLYDGKKICTCNRCGFSFEETIPAHGHKAGEPVNQSEPDCTYFGYTGDRYCIYCETLLETGEKIPELGHIWATEPGAAPTCTSFGKTEKVWCKRCQRVEKESVEIPMLEHTEKIIPEKAATCEEDGCSEEIVCAVCGQVLREKYTVSAHGHSWDYDHPVETEPTCTQPGKKVYVECSYCGKKKGEDVSYPATGHKYDEWRVSFTSAEEEILLRDCIYCGEEERKTISAFPSASEVVLGLNEKSTALKVELTAGDSVVSWKSSNSKIVKVTGKSDGTCVLKSGKKTGEVNVTYRTKKGRSSTVTVIVQKITKTKKITGVPKSKTLKKGKSYTLKPVLTPRNSTENLSYKTSNKKVATVSKNGVIKAKKKGTAIITVMSGKIKKTCKIVVK